MNELLKAKTDLYRLLGQEFDLSDDEFDIQKALDKDLHKQSFKFVIVDLSNKDNILKKGKRRVDIDDLPF